MNHLCGEYLAFEIEEQEYAINILSVQEIRGWEKPRPIPDAPAFVQGALDLRKQVIPIFDMRARLSLQAHPKPSSCVTIIIKLPDRCPFGLTVDSVSDVHLLEEAHLRQAPDLKDNSQTSCILAMAKVASNLIVLLDLEAFIDPIQNPKWIEHSIIRKEAEHG